MCHLSTPLWRHPQSCLQGRFVRCAASPRRTTAFAAVPTFARASASGSIRTRGVSSSSRENSAGAPSITALGLHVAAVHTLLRAAASQQTSWNAGEQSRLAECLRAHRKTPATSTRSEGAGWTRLRVLVSTDVGHGSAGSRALGRSNSGPRALLAAMDRCSGRSKFNCHGSRAILMLMCQQSFPGAQQHLPRFLAQSSPSHSETHISRYTLETNPLNLN
mmetsp:Transcript_8613/g.25877  ORF Transcript_8613/g.25877 Transcript_8613/m.25877 type:complete len:219 (+) Transcript_8613:478-1134(+)